MMAMMSLLAMVTATPNAKTQEITITLNPGWNWISYPNAEAMDIATALGDFIPVSGDIINSQSDGSATYLNGRWRGGLTHFIPGKGYMYYSARTEATSFVFAETSSPSVHEYVDLGLPSGTLWATCNVGADAPEEYGDYFAWGETQSKEIYNWSTYQYCMGSETTLTKYCSNSSYGYNGFTDTLTTLLLVDDAATANWGANWRMPTVEEWRELYYCTTCTWTTQNGVYGRLFTSSNGNSIFLPAAGNCNEGNLNGVGSDGYYWSSSLDTNNPYGAWDYIFNWGTQQIAPHNRYRGWSVRAVRSVVSYTIEVESNPVEGGTVTIMGHDGTSADFEFGTNVTVTATSAEGYTFTGWTSSDTDLLPESTNAIYEFTMPNGNVTLTANFEAPVTQYHYVMATTNTGNLNNVNYSYVDEILAASGYTHHLNDSSTTVPSGTYTKQFNPEEYVGENRKVFVIAAPVYYNVAKIFVAGYDQNVPFTLVPVNGDDNGIPYSSDSTDGVRYRLFKYRITQSSDPFIINKLELSRIEP